LAACGNDQGPTQARQSVVIDAGGAQLLGSKLEAWLTSSRVQPSAPAVALVVNTWIDEALLAKAMQDHVALDDSATVDAVIREDAVRGEIAAYWAERLKQRPAISDRQVDSLLEQDRVRVLQQIVLRVPAGSDSATQVAVIDRARQVLARARKGDDFSALVKQYSEDSLTRANNGFLPAFQRADLPAAIAAQTWALRPGEVSALVASPMGVHIMRRATRDESRAGLRAWLAPVVARRVDSVFVDSVGRALGFTLDANVVARLRTMASQPNAPDSGPPIATWKGGEMSALEARNWIMMVNPAARVLLAGASDSAVRIFAREAGQREYVAALAAPAGVPTPKARETLAPEYRAGLDSVMAQLRAVAGNRTPAEAATAYVDSLIKGLPFRPLPGALSGVLRLRYPVRVDSVAINALTEFALTTWQKTHADTTANDSTVKAPGQ
jgi:hypothetical protein